MPLAWRVVSAVFLVLAVRGSRWGYGSFVVLALLSFAVRAGFHLTPRACELLVGPSLALYSFRNFPHIVLFAPFFMLSRIQFRGPGASGYALLATVIMGMLVELAEGASGQGHCRLRDILPDTAGAGLGWLTFVAAQQARRWALALASAHPRA